jgi:TMEM175 potassium channel family protein
VTKPTEETGSGERDYGADLTTERLIFFSDAVVAIAITLLAFTLPSLPVGTSATTNSDVWHSLTGHGSAYLAFVISFVVIGSHWRSHHRLFRSVQRLDPTITTLNMIWLFLIVVQPYATRVLGGNGAYGVRFSFYAIVQVATLLCFMQMAHRMRRLGLRSEDPATAADNDLRTVTFMAMFSISVPLSFVTHWAYLCWLAAPVVLRVALTLRHARDGRDNEDGSPRATPPD